MNRIGKEDIRAKIDELDLELTNVDLQIKLSYFELDFAMNEIDNSGILSDIESQIELLEISNEFEQDNIDELNTSLGDLQVDISSSRGERGRLEREKKKIEGEIEKNLSKIKKLNADLELAKNNIQKNYQQAYEDLERLAIELRRKQTKKNIIMNLLLIIPILTFFAFLYIPSVNIYEWIVLSARRETIDYVKIGFTCLLVATAITLWVKRKLE